MVVLVGRALQGQVRRRQTAVQRFLSRHFAEAGRSLAAPTNAEANVTYDQAAVY